MPSLEDCKAFNKLLSSGYTPRVRFVRLYDSPSGTINEGDEGKVVDDDDESIVNVYMDDGKSCWIQAYYLEVIE